MGNAFEMFLNCEIRSFYSVPFIQNIISFFGSEAVKKRTGVLIGFGMVLLFLTALWWGQRDGIKTASETVSQEETEEEKDFIRWVDFKVTCEAMDLAYDYEMETRQGETPLNWISLLAYAGAKTGGEFQNWKKVAGYITEAAEGFLAHTISEEELSSSLKFYSYYKEAYSAVLEGLVGEYRIQTEEGGPLEEKYGLKGFLPIAKQFPYSDYDDFGASRSYGYKRQHLGHDMMGQVGTPVIAVESGVVEAMGWNQYGGWRMGIRSFDGKRYYYYAHLRKDFPYCKSLEEGSVVLAGDVIGYMGRTGYSTVENTNNIEQSHLHFGLQLIFDESQKEGNGEIWVDCYQLVRFLYQNRSEAVRDDSTKEWHRKYEFQDPAAEAYKKSQNASAPSGR